VVHDAALASGVGVGRVGEGDAVRIGIVVGDGDGDGATHAASPTRRTASDAANAPGRNVMLTVNPCLRLRSAGAKSSLAAVPYNGRRARP